MLRTFLRAKLHQARITRTDPDYEGSITLDRVLCRAVGLLELEQVDVYDITNGARFTTYVIYGGPGEVQVNGAAARLVNRGDTVIVAAYAQLTPAQVRSHSARVALVDEANRVREVLRQGVARP